jgi:hypothetical protein
VGDLIVILFVFDLKCSTHPDAYKILGEINVVLLFDSGVMLQVSFVFILSSSKNDVVIKIIIRFVIDHY